MDELNANKPEIVEQLQKPRRNLWIPILAIAAVAIAFWVTHQPNSVEQAQPEKMEAVSAKGMIQVTPDQLKQIQVEPVREETIDLNLEATGKVGFNEDRLTPVVVPYSGRVLEVLANKGDLVKVGQPLLVIESPDLVSAVNDLIEAQSGVDKANIAVDIAQKSAERARRLNAQEALATKELQATESELARAREDVRHAEASVAIARNRLSLLGKSNDEIAQLESSPPDRIDRRIVIRAPITGTIVERKLGSGQYVKPDSPDPLYLISDLSTLWVTGDVYESDLSRIHVGAPVDIHVAAYPERNFPARISAINPTVDPATRTVRVRCLVPNSAGLLKPEMFASIRIGDAVKRKVLTVPSSAVLTEGERSLVLVEASSGRFNRRQVKSGREVGGNTVVEEGLHLNDRVVTSGVLLLNNSEGSKP